MPIDPNTPVLLGAGQFTEHLDDNFKALMPEDLAARACEAALADTGAAESLHPSDRPSRLCAPVRALCTGPDCARYRAVWAE
jgi:hypothetical protein